MSGDIRIRPVPASMARLVEAAPREIPGDSDLAWKAGRLAEHGPLYGVTYLSCGHTITRLA
jgi:hypothetical protein